MPIAIQIVLAVVLLAIGYTVGRRRRAPRWLAGLIGIGAALLPIAAARATTFTVPFTFTNGTVADASQVNQNFATIAAEIDRLRKGTSVVTDCAFRPASSTAQIFCGTGQGGAFIGNADFGAIAAPINVPQGAAINSVDVWVADTNATLNLQICVYAEFDSAGFFDESPPCVTTSAAPGIVKLTVTPASPVVHGNGEAFQVYAYVRDSGGNLVNWPTPGDSLSVRTAYVHYEIP
jgi:hypothetical protein